MVVEEVMSRDPIRIQVSQSVREAMHSLLSADIRHLPVVEEGELVGMLSDRDLRSLTNDDLSADERSNRLALPVSEVMSSNVVSVDPETDVLDVIDLILEHKIGAVPVVQDARLVGIVSYMDVLRVAKEAFED